MPPTTIHQAIHGYRDGHRLLSSSLSLGADASRAMLVLTDMSGPSMHPGFSEYLTGYPLPGTEHFVFAKTWYAPEMQRPGCVWTHSLLIPRENLSQVSTARLLTSLRRPQTQSADSVATAPLILDEDAVPSSLDGLEDDAVTAALFEAVLGQPRPVVVPVDAATQLESVFLRIWEELWPAAKANFAFCTGALMPRSIAGTLMDLQAIPRAIPSAQFRKSAGTALVLDLRALGSPEGWVTQVLQSAARGDTTFRKWMEAAVGTDSGRGAAPGLVALFGQWNQANWSPHAGLAATLDATELAPVAKARVLGMILDRAGAQEGAGCRRELLQELFGQPSAELSTMTNLLEEQTGRLFAESRTEGCSLVLSLLGSELTEVGERVVRGAVLSLAASDVETFGASQLRFLPTIVGLNPALAASSELWKQAGSRGPEILAQLSTADLNDEERTAIVDAVIGLGASAPVQALVRFGGKVAISRVLSALATERLPLTGQWRSQLSAHPNAVVKWLEGHSAVSPRELEVASQLLSPSVHPNRLAKPWHNGTVSAVSLSPRVAAFGLALSLSAQRLLPLLAACFQPTFDALVTSRIEYETWEWLRDLAPPVSWWRDWDRCERIAAALARLLKDQDASLETMFGIVRSRAAIRKVASVLDRDREDRRYLKALRKNSLASPDIGTQEQRYALLED